MLCHWPHQSFHKRKRNKQIGLWHGWRTSLSSITFTPTNQGSLAIAGSTTMLSPWCDTVPETTKKPLGSKMTMLDPLPPGRDSYLFWQTIIDYNRLWVQVWACLSCLQDFTSHCYLKIIACLNNLHRIPLHMLTTSIHSKWGVISRHGHKTHYSYYRLSHPEPVDLWERWNGLLKA